MLNKKCTKLVAAMGITLFAGTAQAAYQDIAVNGDFETGDFTGWAQFPGSSGPAGQTIVTGNPGSAARLVEFNPAPNIIKQANLLPGAWTPGQQIDISLDFRGTTGAGGVFFIELFSEVDGGGTSSAVILGGGPQFPASATEWQTLTFTGFAGPDTTGGITLQLNAACAPVEGCISDIQIDNVQIFADVEVPQVPVPAAVWLFGSGLLGLVGVARRKKALAA